MEGWKDGRTAIRIPLNPLQKSVDEYAEEVYRLLQTSVRRQLISDVPLGVFLSGGIDSSAITGLMSQMVEKPVNTFSVGFEIGGAYNELADAAIVAKRFGTEHHELVVKEANLVELLNKLVYHYDEPFGDAACFPTYLVSEFARKSVKVVLSGEGGDELFGGYRRYSAERFSKYYQKLPIFLRDGFIRKLVNSIPRSRRLKKAITSMSVEEPDVRYASWLVVFSDEMKRELFTAEINEVISNFDSFEVYRKYYNRRQPPAPFIKGDGELIDRLLYTDQKTWLVDTYLEKTDKASMAVGLEARVPFLDHELVEFAATIPSKYKIKGFTKKYILKKAMRGLLPESVIKKPKHGFSVPTDPWFRGKLKEYVFEVLFDSQTRKRGYFNYPYIEKLYREHLDGKEVYDFHLWLLLNFELWHRTFMDHCQQIKVTD
jgi:asparagine synthase (glutamine-hydrolysing)